MEQIKGPIEFDFFFDPKPLTKEEQKMIRDFIKADKEKRKSKKLTNKKHLQMQTA